MRSRQAMSLLLILTFLFSCSKEDQECEKEVSGFLIKGSEPGPDYYYISIDKGAWVEINEETYLHYSELKDRQEITCWEGVIQ